MMLVVLLSDSRLAHAHGFRLSTQQLAPARQPEHKVVKADFQVRLAVG